MNGMVNMPILWPLAIRERSVTINKSTKESLYKGLKKQCRKQGRDISFAIQDTQKKKYGYGVVRELVGTDWEKSA